MIIPSREFWFVMPFPPSINRRMNKRYKPKEHVAAFNLAARQGSNWDGCPMKGSIEVTFYLQHSTRRKVDITNVGKEVLDGYTAGGLWEDDSQVDVATFIRLPFKKGDSKCYVHIKEISQECLIAIDKGR